MYYVYMLRCIDNSIYTGITTNVEKRFKEHLERGNKGAKYTKTHHAKKIEREWKSIFHKMKSVPNILNLISLKN